MVSTGNLTSEQGSKLPLQGISHRENKGMCLGDLLKPSVYAKAGWGNILY